MAVEDAGLIGAIPTEAPFFFPSNGEVLLGVVTEPLAVEGPRPASVADGPDGAIIVPGGWLGLSSGRNRSLVRVAWTLATRGMRVFRFDYHGVGESTGSIGRFELAAPFVDDLLSVINHARGHGIGRFYLVGFCFGARAALAAADLTQGVEGLVLVSVPVRMRDEREGGRGRARLAQHASLSRALRLGLAPWLLRDAFRPERRKTYAKIIRAKSAALKANLSPRRREARGPSSDPASPEFQRVLEQVLDRGIPILMIYGDSDAAHEDFLKAKAGQLGKILERYDSLVDLVELEGDVHGLGRLRVQESVIGAITTWLRRQSGRDAASGSSNRPIGRTR
jgi:pimeloyl-ACP methyl ester carboxylesterase